MSMPFYASAEQIMRDRSEFARKGIARGRSVVVLTYADGMLFVAENASSALHKVSEIYDRIGFAAVGKYNEFENLRVAGIRLADLRGYSYDRRDVTARALANAYAQTLGSIFTEQQKPYEVEICVAEVGATRRRRPALPAVLRRHDRRRARLPGHGRPGRVADDRAARRPIGPGLSLADALALAVPALGSVGANGAPRTLPAAQLEVAVLDRTRANRKFKRITGPRWPPAAGPAAGGIAAARRPADTPPHDADARRLPVKTGETGETEESES